MVSRVLLSLSGMSGMEIGGGRLGVSLVHGGLWSGFKVRTTRPAAGGSVRILNIDRESGT